MYYTYKHIHVHSTYTQYCTTHTLYIHILSTILYHIFIPIHTCTHDVQSINTSINSIRTSPSGFIVICQTSHSSMNKFYGVVQKYIPPISHTESQMKIHRAKSNFFALPFLSNLRSLPACLQDGFNFCELLWHW